MFYKIYQFLCAEKGLSANAIAKQLNISSGTVTEWKNGRVPRNTTLKKIADYFNVSVEYLLGIDTPKTQTQPLSKDELKKAIFGDVGATDEMLEEVLNYAEYVKGKYKKV